MIMDSIAERLLSARKTLGLTQAVLSKKIGIAQGLYSKYETGALDIPDSIKAKLFQYGISLDWLVTGTGSIYKEPAHARDPNNRIITLPVVADIAAGIGIEAEDIEPREHISVPALLLPTSGPYYCFRVSGISMEPELHTGDYAIIAGAKFDVDYNGSICAFRGVDGLLIKRLVVDHRGKRSLLIPLNPSQPIQIYDESSADLVLIGRLITVIRKYT